MKLDGYNNFGGRSADLGALKNVLAFSGVTAPHTGKPYTEEMLLGIGGGVGVIYFTFQFDHLKTMYVGTRDVRTNGKPNYIQTAVERIGGSCTIEETTGAKGAANSLRAALEEGKPAIVWLDLASLPYSGLAPDWIKYFEHIAAVFGLEDGKAYIGDQAATPLVITEEELAVSRKAITNQKHRLLTVDPPSEAADLLRAIKAGISDCIRGMVGPAITNFGLKGLQKWADRLTNTKDKQGWPGFFPRGQYLFDALKSTHDYIEFHGTGGSASRPMYAAFLSEASAALENSELEAAADEYRHAADLWHGIAETALPDSVPIFKETKNLLARRDRLFREEGHNSTIERTGITERLTVIREQVAGDFPLTQPEADDLLAELRRQVYLLHDCEVRAVNMLQTVVDGM